MVFLAGGAIYTCYPTTSYDHDLTSFDVLYFLGVWNFGENFITEKAKIKVYNQLIKLT